MKTSKLIVNGSEISFININTEDYISLNDIAKHKDSNNTDTIIQNWLRNRNTIELLGYWELIYNPDFKPLEFEGFKKVAIYHINSKIHTIEFSKSIFTH